MTLGRKRRAAFLLCSIAFAVLAAPAFATPAHKAAHRHHHHAAHRARSGLHWPLCAARQLLFTTRRAQGSRKPKPCFPTFSKNIAVLLAFAGRDWPLTKSDWRGQAGLAKLRASPAFFPVVVHKLVNKIRQRRLNRCMSVQRFTAMRLILK